MVLLQKANHKGSTTEAEEKVCNIVETDMSAKKYRKTFRHAGQKWLYAMDSYKSSLCDGQTRNCTEIVFLANNLNEDDSAEIRKHLANLHFQVLQSDKYDATFIK